MVKRKKKSYASSFVILMVDSCVYIFEIRYGRDVPSDNLAAGPFLLLKNKIPPKWYTTDNNIAILLVYISFFLFFNNILV